MMPALIGAFKAWREKWRSKMEMFEFFSAGAGGWGVLNAADDRELSQIMLEYPFQAFSANELIPTVNGDDALQRLGETFEQMMAAMKQGG
jgi:hypothetical protein